MNSFPARIVSFLDQDRRLMTIVLTIAFAGLISACGGGGGGGGGVGGGGGGGVTLSSIAVTPKASLVVGATQQLVATGTYSDKTTKDISSTATWTSSNTSVATITPAGGLGTAISGGVSTITAALSGVSGTNTLTVVILNSIALTPAHAQIAPGKNQQYTATATYSDGSTKDITASITGWNSTDTTVATITATTGLATVIKSGTTNIGASTFNGILIQAVPLTGSNARHAYATNFNDGTVSQYSIDVATGSLSPLSAPTIAAGVEPFSISVEPSGQYAYVANYTAGTVSEYIIAADGSLALVGNGSVPTGAKPNAVIVELSNHFAYVANYGANSVSQYAIQPNGMLVPLSPPTIPTGPTPASITIDPTSRYAYVANYNGSGIGISAGPASISQYTIGKDGTLTAMNPATVSTGLLPNSITVDPSGKYVYVANQKDNTVGSVGQYAIDPATGMLSPIGSGTVTAGAQPFALTVDPSGKHVYVANYADGTISQFSIGPVGALTALSPTASVPSGTHNGSTRVSSVNVDPAGSFAYATNRGDGTISQYSIDTTGALVPLAIAIVPSGTTPASEPTSIATGY